MARLSHVLVPGRHHALTRFQASYLHELVSGRLRDLDGEQVELVAGPTLVWAVTSANRQNTRRNPVPANRREVAIELFSLHEGFRSVVVPVFDTRPTERFAEITLTAVQTGAGLNLDPTNCVVAVSTPSVIEMYRKLGFRIAPLELNHPDVPLRAWQVLELCAAGDPAWRDHAHRATVDVFDRYGLEAQAAMVLSDPIVSPEGSLTETRNYRAYVASFEASAGRKWAQARPYVVPGRIVDIGCATGAILELAARDCPRSPMAETAPGPWVGASRLSFAGGGRPCTRPTAWSARKVNFRQGDVFVWTGGDKTIFNLATQPVPRPSARLEYIEHSLRKAVGIAESRSIAVIGMPRIGAGYGGLEWPDVKGIVEAIATETPVVVAVYERPGPRSDRS